MKKELIIKKCPKCGAVVRVIEDCTCDNCGIKCCGEEMIKLKANSTDAAFEKHVPEVEIEKDKIVVKVNHVMESDHYIEWIAMVTEREEFITYLTSDMEPRVEFPYVENSIIYSYCNKHGLWSKEL
jgi:superoxide reductase